MKKNSSALLSQISKQHLDQLTFIVKETIAVTTASKQRLFTSADLWNIQRQAKKKVQRKMMF